MPELPEVESLVGFLRARAIGRRIERVELLSFAAAKTVRPPAELVGRRVTGSERRGKFLTLETCAPGASDGPAARDGAASGTGGRKAATDAPLFLVLHLARAGWVRWIEDGGAGSAGRDARPRPPRSGPLALRVRFAEGGGFDVTEAGTQKRLAVYVVARLDEVAGIAHLGIDPLDPAFTVQHLAALLAGRTGQLKHVLSDQSVIAGIGNAYSDEALHAARFSPYKPAGGLRPDEIARLHAGIVGVLRDALARSSGRPIDELKDEKRAGMRVHGRTGLPCPVCGDSIREVAFADRSLQYCPTCQTEGRPLADRRFSRFLK